MRNDRFEAICILSLIHGLRINQAALDTPIPIRLSNGIVGELWLPIVVPEGNSMALGAPFLLEQRNYYDYYWGDCDIYYQRNGVSYNCCIVKTVVLKMFSDKKWNSSSLLRIQEEIKHRTRIFFEITYFYAPFCIEKMGNTRFNEIVLGCDVFTQSANKEIRTPKEFSLEINMDIPLSRRSIIWLLNNSRKELKENYKAISYASVNYKMGDYRDVVLNCATAVEVTLKRKLQYYLSSTNTPSELADHILKKTNGFDKYRQLFASLSIPSINWNDLDWIMKMRNRVIHGGYSPLQNESQKVLEKTRSFLYHIEPCFFK